MCVSGFSITDHYKEVVMIEAGDPTVKIPEKKITIIFGERSIFWGWPWWVKILGPLSAKAQLNIIAALDLLERGDSDVVYVVLNEICPDDDCASRVAGFIRGMTPSKLRGKISFSMSCETRFEDELIDFIAHNMRGQEVIVSIMEKDKNELKKIVKRIQKKITEMPFVSAFSSVRFS